MGADQFTTRARGKTAQEAFSTAVSEAQYESGHGGYTGTIAEKHSFRMVTPNRGESPKECISRCRGATRRASRSARTQKMPKQRIFCFFGWASS